MMLLPARNRATGPVRQLSRRNDETMKRLTMTMLLLAMALAACSTTTTTSGTFGLPVPDRYERAGGRRRAAGDDRERPGADALGTLWGWLRWSAVTELWGRHRASVHQRDLLQDGHLMKKTISRKLHAHRIRDHRIPDARHLAQDELIAVSAQTKRVQAAAGCADYRARKRAEKSRPPVWQRRRRAPAIRARRSSSAWSSRPVPLRGRPFRP